jgi:hypothetical protein
VLATAATLAFQLVSAVPAHAVTTKTDTNYAIDSNPKLKNPERGMYFGGLPGPDGFHTIVPEWLWLTWIVRAIEGVAACEIAKVPVLQGQ